MRMDVEMVTGTDGETNTQRILEEKDLAGEMAMDRAAESENFVDGDTATEDLHMKISRWGNVYAFGHGSGNGDGAGNGWGWGDAVGSGDGYGRGWGYRI